MIPWMHNRVLGYWIKAVLGIRGCSIAYLDDVGGFWWNCLADLALSFDRIPISSKYMSCWTDGLRTSFTTINVSDILDTFDLRLGERTVEGGNMSASSSRRRGLKKQYATPFMLHIVHLISTTMGIQTSRHHTMHPIPTFKPTKLTPPLQHEQPA